MNILDKIIETKRTEVANLSIETSTVSKERSNYSLLDALAKPGLTLIAEVKHASPSKGIIYESFNPKELAETFEKNGAGCISVLTDRDYFKGSINDLRIVRESVKLPILRKDFIIDPIQIIEAKAIGANVILLILDILPIDLANKLLATAREYQLDVLIEVHDNNTLSKIPDLIYKDIIGINNRNLTTFDVNPNHALNVGLQLKETYPGLKIVAESGYQSIESLEELEKKGIDGVLIGEGLSKNKDLLEWFKKWRLKYVALQIEKTH